MPIGLRLPYARIIACDFEYRAEPGDRPDVHCMVAEDLVSGQVWRLWRDDMGAHPPFPTDASTLVLSPTTTAPSSMPSGPSGGPFPSGPSTCAPSSRRSRTGSPCPMAGGCSAPCSTSACPTWTPSRRRHARPRHEGRALHRGREAGARRLLRRGRRRRGQVVRAAGERAVSGPRPCPDVGSDALQGRLHGRAVRGRAPGIPLDAPLLHRLRSNWPAILAELIRRTDALYGVFEGGSFRYHLFERYLATRGRGRLAASAGRAHGSSVRAWSNACLRLGGSEGSAGPRPDTLLCVAATGFAYQSQREQAHERALRRANSIPDAAGWRCRAR